MNKKQSRPLITYPYRGSRRSYYVYHPALHGSLSKDGLWEDCCARFKHLLDSFTEVCELYTEQQVLSESVGGSRWKRDVEKLWRAIAQDDKDIYQLECLAMVLYNVEQEEKTQQRMIPYHEEIKQAASSILQDDFGLSLTGGLVNPRQIVQRGWAA